MASAPRPSARPKQTWRERSRPQETPREVKLLQRWLASLVLVALVGAMAWWVYTAFFQPKTVIVCLPVTNYGKHRVPPVPFFENDARYLAQVREGIETLITFGERDSLVHLTEKLNKFELGAKDTLILYVSAHGVSLARDGKTTKGYLLCGEKEGADNAEELIEIGAFLKSVQKGTDARKIILLDAGHIGAAPQLGMMVNEFPKYLEKAVHDLKDEGVWVLSANALHETSHVAHSKSQSAFNDFVVRGLKGEADAGPNANNFVDLSELVVFVGIGVRDWVKSQYGSLEHQTPQILWGGGGITSGVIDGQMQTIILSRALPPPTPDAEAPQAETKTTKTAVARSPRERSLLSSTIMPGSLALGQPSPATEPAPAQTTATPPAPAPPAEATPKPDAPATPTAAAPTGAAQAPPASTTPAPPAPNPAAPPPTAASPAPAGDPKAAAKPPAADKEPDVPDPLAGLRDAWKERDSVLKSESSGWSPVDYAPHTWRVFESSLLDFEVRYRNAFNEKPEFKPDDSARQIAAAGSKFAESRLPVETSGFLYEALRARNRGIYRAIDLVAWHCRASLGRTETLVQFDAINKLLGKLEEIETRLSALSDTASKPDELDGGRLAEHLKELTKDIDEALSKIDQSLVRSVEVGLAGSTKGPLPKDVARELEDLLSIPLADTENRMRLVEALARVGEQRKERATLDSDRQLEYTAPNRVIKQLEEGAAADAKSAMARATEQARLEWRLIKLANLHQEGPNRRNLEELLPATGYASLGELAKFGYELVRLYRSLPNSVTKDPPNHADGELRLQPAYQPTTFSECLTVASAAHWALPEKPEVALSSPVTTLSLDVDSKWYPVTLQVAAIGKFTGTVQVHAEYDKSKLKLEAVNDESAVHDAQSQPIRLDADHPSAQLQYQAQRWGLAAGEVVKVTFVATSPEHPSVESKTSISLEAPSPNDIDLVIAPAGGIDGPDGPQLAGIGINDALVSNAKPQDDNDAIASPRRVPLSTFAGHQTAFDFKLKHQLSRDRKVKVELYAVSERDPLKLEGLYHLAAKDPQKFVEGLGKSQSAAKKVAEAKELVLPKNSTQGVPIEWTPFPSPAPAKDTPAAAAAATPKSDPEPTTLDGGLICVVQEPGQDSAPWITWVEVAPYAPDQYIAPRVQYEGSGRLRVDLQRTAEARPLDGRTIQVELEDSPDVKLRIKKSAVLLPKNGFHDWVQAEVSDTADSQETIEIRLTVDGYPRAFIYRLTPLDRNLPKGKKDWERNLTSLEVIQPHKLDCFKPEPDGKSRVPVRLQVTAPSNRFIRNRTFREQVKDTIEVGIDDDDDGRPNPPLRNFYSDRLTTLRLGAVESGGRLAIDTSVDDLHFELPCPDLNKHANLVAVLKFDDQEARSASVECVFDDRPPRTPVAPELALMNLGEKKTLKVTATDGEQGSGIKAIHYAYNTVDRNEAKKKPNPPLTVTNNQSEYEVPFSEEWTSAGPKQMIVWSEDRVGLLSEPAEVLVDVKPKAAMPADKPAAKFGTIRGKVTYGGRPVARATVGVAKGAGPTRTLERATKTDSDGKFEIKNLPPGDYPLEAEGTARNQLRKSKEPTTVTIPTPPQEKPVEVEIKL